MLTVYPLHASPLPHTQHVPRYHKRVDYGDGEWPSKWPSELEQDEFSGWHPADPAKRAALIAAGQLHPEVTEAVATAGAGAGAGAGGAVGVTADGWSKYPDAASGTQYYYNQQSGKSTYRRPSNFVTPRPEDGTLVETGQRQWQKYWDEEGQAHFYYNATTGESTYDRPLDFATPRVSESTQMVATGENNWVKYWDDAANLDFYYNNVTGESTYDRPKEYYTPRVQDGQLAVATGDNNWAKYVAGLCCLCHHTAAVD